MWELIWDNIWLYYGISTLVAWYYLMGIPTANVHGPIEYAASLIIALLVGWLCWWIFMVIYVWIRMHPEEIAHYLRKHEDPRWRGYASKIKTTHREEDDNE